MFLLVFLGLLRGSRANTNWTSLTGQDDWISVVAAGSVGSTVWTMSNETTTTRVYLSVDGGTTNSIKLTVPGDAYDIATNATGTFAIVGGSYVYWRTFNGGTTWTQTDFGTHNYRAVSCDSSGTYVLMMGYKDGSTDLFVSNDAGGSFTKKTGGAVYSVAVSGTGQYMGAAGDSVFVSSDYGSIFTESYSIPLSVTLNSIAISFSGQFWATCGSSGSQSNMYISTDFGASWADPSVSVYSTLTQVAMSSNGQVMIVTSYSDIYMSTDSGVTWSQAFTQSDTMTYCSMDYAGVYQYALSRSSTGGYRYYAIDNGASVLPTIMPTLSPTPLPSVSPTTRQPTTDRPTNSPTVRPSQLPSAAPSEVPSTLPTLAPTLSPSTLLPSAVPTSLAPSAAPTNTAAPSTGETPDSAADDNSSGGSSMSSGALIGVIVGGVVLLIAVVLGCYAYCNRVWCFVSGSERLISNRNIPLSNVDDVL